jgi:hypothetical protein
VADSVAECSYSICTGDELLDDLTVLFKGEEGMFEKTSYFVVLAINVCFHLFELRFFVFKD